MLHYSRERCSPSWDEEDERGPNSLARKFRDGCRAVCAELANPEDDFAEPPGRGASEWRRTDLGNAERMAAQHGGELRFVAPWKKWLVWDSSRWKPDTGGEAMRRAKRTARGIYTEAKDAEDPDTRAALAKHATASEARPRLEASLALAQSEKPIAATPESFDADGWLLNCENGTIDLRTGELRPHDPGDLLTKTTGIEIASVESGPPPLWLRFLDTVFDGDAELVAFVQRLFGYALVGEQVEHVFPILWGSGANGKSVLIGTIQHCLGEYAAVAAPQLFTVKRGDSHPTELADLHGRRLVVLNETRSGDQLDEGLVKAITGGDRIRARRMKEDFWEFDPSHLACMVTNHKPRIDGCDEGIWRRVLLIPFDVTIPPAKRDSKLPEKLRSEAPAILRWLVDGCLEWQCEGLNPPERVRAATQEYRAEADPVARWFLECCEEAPGERCAASALVESYDAWAQEHREEGRTAKSLAAWLLAKGLERKKLNTGNAYVGVRLRPEADATGRGAAA